MSGKISNGNTRFYPVHILSEMLQQDHRDGSLKSAVNNVLEMILWYHQHPIIYKKNDRTFKPIKVPQNTTIYDKKWYTSSNCIMVMRLFVLNTIKSSLMFYL